MQEIDTRGLDDFCSTLDDLLREFPEGRRQLHEELAGLAKQEVDLNISSAINDSHSKVRGWQKSHVGTGGGYAAVRAAGSKEGAPAGPNGPGAITNYLDSGHKIRRPRFGSPPRKGRAKLTYVEGRHFYGASRSSLESTAIQAAETFAAHLAQRLEGSA